MSVTVRVVVVSDFVFEIEHPVGEPKLALLSLISSRETLHRRSGAVSTVLR